MNGGTKWVFGVISALMIMWLAWTSSATVTNGTEVAVVKSQMYDLRCGISELKEMVKDIRDDQKRLQRKETRYGGGD